MIREIFNALANLSGGFLVDLIQVVAIALFALLVLSLALRLAAWILGSIGAIATAWNRIKSVGQKNG